MFFYRHLLVGKSIKDPGRIRKALMEEDWKTNCFLLLYVPDPENAHPVEICHCIMLRQPYYRANPPCVLGIASDKKEAVELLRQLVERAVLKTGKPDVRACLFPDKDEAAAHREEQV